MNYSKNYFLKTLLAFTLVIGSCNGMQKIQNFTTSVKKWVNKKKEDLQLAIRKWRTPRPRLLSHKIFILEKNTKWEQKFDVFSYDVSRDDNTVIETRRRLHIPGLYLGIQSGLSHVDKEMFEQQGLYISQERYNDYKNRGYREWDNHTIARCMSTLFYENQFNIFIPLDKKVFLQLLWELENALPKEFDNDKTGKVFLDFIKFLIEVGPREYPLAWEYRGIFLHIWQNNTLRFIKNDGLAEALSQMSKRSRKNEEY